MVVPEVFISCGGRRVERPGGHPKRSTYGCPNCLTLARVIRRIEPGASGSVRPDRHVALVRTDQATQATVGFQATDQRSGGHEVQHQFDQECIGQCAAIYLGLHQATPLTVAQTTAFRPRKLCELVGLNDLYEYGGSPAQSCPTRPMSYPCHATTLWTFTALRVVFMGGHQVKIQYPDLSVV